MDDDVRQSSTDRYALSQAYRWRAERDQARQELQEIQARLMPEGMEWLLDVWPKWSNGDYCKFGDWWTAECYGEFEPKQLRKLSIYTPEQLDEFGQGNGKDYGYEWDFFRPSYVTYHPVKVEPPAPKVLAADGEPLLDGDEVWRVKDGSGPYHVQEVRDGVSVCVGETHCEFRPDELTHQRPVLDADGEPLEVGQTVYMLNDDRPYTVKKVETNRVSVNAGEGAYDVWKAPTYLTHQRPVLAADGEPLREGETVWDIEDEKGYPHTVTSTELDGLGHVKTTCEEPTPASVSIHPSRLTHERPEVDSWSRLEEDAKLSLCEYNLRHKPAVGDGTTLGEDVRVDLVRRCKALAERERGD